ncbi:MAG: DAK2 domain-containing protein [Anaerolineae bacterium]|nr:MAG: DAK2 domain-containing protein [Anaerolineae bacterium]
MDVLWVAKGVVPVCSLNGIGMMSGMEGFELSAEIRTESRDAHPAARQHRADGPVLRCDGQVLKHLIEAGLAWLEQHSAAVNALNVFPVPDGDTGTNMLLTLQSAYKEIVTSPETSIAEVAQAAAYGALMGARGNSGVILSQILRGFAHGVDGCQAFDADDFASALRSASETAYKGVIQPVEGTILTVIRESAEAAEAIVSDTDDLKQVLAHVVHEAAASVARTPMLLQVLREAGVVDAGGQGLYLILEGMLRYVRGETVRYNGALEAEVSLLRAEAVAGEYGYDVQFIIQGDSLSVDEVRTAISSMGDSVLVVGDARAIKVHVHTPEPGTPLNYGVGVGALSQVIVENMQEQYQEFVMGQARPAPAVEEICDIASVAVASGEGLARVFESLGVSAVVRGGQTMNPSTEDLLKAVEAASVDNVILLPNNSNVILAAEQAKALSQKNVVVVLTKTMPQGVGAMLAFNYQADLETNARVMARAAAGVETIEVTTATRDVEISGVAVREGQIIGLLNDQLQAVGDSPEEVILAILSELDLTDFEIITVYWGQDVTQDEAEALVAQIEDLGADLEIELVIGGQPHYFYILSLE